MERGKRKEDERKRGRRKERFKNKYMQREREREWPGVRRVKTRQGERDRET